MMSNTDEKLVNVHIKWEVLIDTSDGEPRSGCGGDEEIFLQTNAARFDDKTQLERLYFRIHKAIRNAIYEFEEDKP
jgi:hypothetical protein